MNEAAWVSLGVVVIGLVLIAVSMVGIARSRMPAYDPDETREIDSGMRRSELPPPPGGKR